MAATRHATLMQISDLHFGDIDALGKLVYDREIPLLWTALPFCRGLAGHSKTALGELKVAYDKICEEDKEVVLLITGDLTSAGKNAQLENAIRYIGSRWAPLEGSHGLMTGDWLERSIKDGVSSQRHDAIPGNHDHWPGRSFFLGEPRPFMKQWAGRYPLIRRFTIPLRGTKAFLRLLAVNSDAGVWGWGPERWLARGHSLAQIRRLAADLDGSASSDSNEVRVLLQHHSLCYKSTALCSPLELNLASRRELIRVLARCDIPVLLTGHTHQPAVETFSVRSYERPSPSRQMRRHVFLEACCGTTTQVNKVQRKWRHGILPMDENSFLVHRLTSEKGTIVWETETWWRTHNNGFEPAHARLSGDHWQARLTVWPRPSRD
jgi:hypothetical protein